MNDYTWYTPAVYDAQGNYRYTGKDHIVGEDGKTLCGTIDTRNHFPGTGTYNTGKVGTANECGTCSKALES